MDEVDASGRPSVQGLTADQVAAHLEREGGFRRWIESTAAGFWVIDEQARTTYVNASMARMLGYTPDEMIGMPLDAFMDEHGKRISERNLDRRRQGVEEQHEFEFVGKDGRRIYTIMETAPYRDAAGTYAGAIAFVLDTSQQHADQRVAQQLAAIVDSTGDAVIRADAEGIINYWNAGAERLFGFTEAEALGSSIMTLCPPALRAGQREARNRVLAGQPSAPLDTVRLHKDGRNLDVSIVLSPVYDETGQLDGLSAVIRDIGDRVAAERRLRETNQLLSSIVASAGDAIFMKDADHVYRFANSAAEQLLGVAPGALVGRTDADIAPPDEVADRVARDREVMDGRRAVTLEYQQLVADRLRWISETRSPLFADGDDGPVSGVVVVARDITEQRAAVERERRAEAEMLHTQKLESLGVLAGGIAHDFNNLLVGVLGNAELAARVADEASPIQEDLSAIVQAARRASELCRQLLAYAGRGRFVVTRIELSQAVSEIAALLGVSLAKGAMLQMNLSETPVYVEVDVTQLRQVFMNFVTNASEALDGQTGVVRVTTGSTVVDASYFAECVSRPTLPGGRYAFFEVSDTGSGMDADTLGRIFDPFFTTKFTGRGLGLAAVMGIVRGHGGAIRVYSEVGRGSSFKVLLPQVDIAPLAEPAELRDEPHGRGVVLVIDDEETVRRFVWRALARSGYEVITAASGEEGVARFRSERGRIDAVLVDMNMPGMDGSQTYSELRRLDPRVAIILSSGFNEQEVTSRLAGRGLAGFLAKPYTLDTLLACLSRAIADRPAPDGGATDGGATHDGDDGGDGGG